MTDEFIYALLECLKITEYYITARKEKLNLPKKGHNLFACVRACVCVLTYILSSESDNCFLESAEGREWP